MRNFFQKNSRHDKNSNPSVPTRTGERSFPRRISMKVSGMNRTFTL
ncbi:hypothetical protein CLOSTHATH_05736, partial [Hungatella hathewayi DSM 13479]